VSSEALTKVEAKEDKYMFYVYIFQSEKDGSYYTGITTNLKKRLKYHNSGNQKYTRTKIPYKLKWFCVFPDKKKALAFEKYLKSGSGIAFSRKRPL